MTAKLDLIPPAAWPATLPAMPAMPVVDFSLFGEVETVPRPRHRKLVASFLARNWAQIPHVTHHDEAQVPELDAVRRRVGDELGMKLTPVPFIIKTVMRALQAFPRFNVSLSPDGNGLVMKRYFHIGVAVETLNGLVVPAIRDCDRKSVGEIATATGFSTASHFTQAFKRRWGSTPGQFRRDH